MARPPTNLEPLLAEEPFVRALAHSLVASEADDLVQETWLRAMARAPGSLRQPRSWLAAIVRNLAKDERRRTARRETRHLQAARPDRVQSSAELLEAEEHRRTLVAAVDRLPEHLRSVVLLRYYDGLPPRRIAKTLGLPVSKVWNRLHEALNELRRALDERHEGDRRAWVLPLVPFATLPRSLPWREALASTPLAAAGLGMAVMTMKTTLLSAAFLILGAVLWVGWPWTGTALEVAKPTSTGADLAVAAGDRSPDADSAAIPLAGADQREPVVPDTAATVGRLVVRVRYADEPRPAAHIPVVLYRPDGDTRVDVVRSMTDDSGTARLDAVRPGRYDVGTGRALMPTTIEIRAGELTECDLQLHSGMKLSGIVVDDVGAPVAGALVEVCEPYSNRDPEVMGTTGADGTFVVRACPNPALIGARAAGYSASSLQTASNFDGTPQHVRLELLAAGGMVEGLVVASDGAPVTGAVVRIGMGSTDALPAYAQGGAPLPAQVRTDEAGRFRAVGVPEGSQDVQVLSIGFAPWRGSCEVKAHRAVPIRVTLSVGARCVGVVLAQDGTPVGDATVRVGAEGDFVQMFARSAADGSFAMRDLPVGEVELTVSDEKRGKAAARITTEPGATAHCELKLSNGMELRGRVVDETGQPVAHVDVWVAAQGEGSYWTNMNSTDKDGRFRARFCPEGRLLSVRIVGNALEPLRMNGVDPAAGELQVRVQRAERNVRIRGIVLHTDGKPARGIRVGATREPANTGRGYSVTLEDGSFEIGPLQSGRWRLRIIQEGCAWYLSATMPLVEHETKEIGTIQLHRGGTLLIRVEGAEASRLIYTVREDGGEFITGILPTIKPLRCMPLNPGRYQLWVRGPGVVPQRLPFTVRDGEETELAVRVLPGTGQRFEFRMQAGTEVADSIVFDVLQGDRLVVSSMATAKQGFATEEWFAPGSYSLRVTSAGLQGGAQFSAGSEPGPAVVVQVR